MIRSSVLVLLVLVACRHRNDGNVVQPSGGGGGGGGDAPVPGPPPPVDTRSQGQIIVDILISQGYQCSAEERRWQCMAPNNNWPLYVTYVPSTNPVTIWFDSFENRAFARPCVHFTDAMRDLGNNADYIVSCDDTSQQFRFNTYFGYGPNLQIMPWVNDHLARRANSIKLLDSIRAIRR